MGINKTLFYIVLVLTLSLSTLAITPQSSFNFRNYYNLTGGYVVQSSYFCIGASCIGDWQVLNETSKITQDNNSLNTLILRVNSINGTVVNQGLLINDIQSNVTQINNNLQSEITNRANADTVLQNQINLKLNITDQRYNDTLLIISVNNSLNQETISRINNDSYLQAQINNVSAYNDTNVNNRITSVNNSLNQEIIARQGNDTALQNNINLKLNITDQRYNETGLINSLNNTKAGTGNCAAGKFVVNTTTNGIQCDTPVGEIYTNGTGLTLLNNQFNISNTYIQQFNSTSLINSLNNSINNVNTSTNIKSLGFNLTTELKSYFDSLYYSITNPNQFINNTVNNLNNYYLKNQTYNQTEVNNLLSNINSSNNNSINVLNQSLQNEINARIGNDTEIRNSLNNTNNTLNNNVTNLQNQITSIGNWTKDRVNYYNSTTSDNRFINVAGDTMTGTLGVTNINFSQTPTITCANASIGQLFYDINEKALSYKVNGICLQIGEELYIPATNKLGFQINNGQAVYINGAQGSQATVNLTNANSEATSFVIGLATEDCGINAQCKFTVSGMVHDVDTSSWTEGTRLYISTVNGNLTSTRPLAPLYGAFVGTVIYQHGTQGIILVTPRNGYKLDELHDVLITNNIVNNILQWNGTVWKNVAPYWLNMSDQRYNDTLLINNVNTSNNILQLYASVQKDPQGFPHTDSSTANTKSTLNFTDATRNFTITPVGANYTYYIAGRLVTQTSVKSLNITNLSGTHFIYFDTDNNLYETQSFTNSLLCDKVLVAIVYWNAPRNLRYMMNDERHTNFMECQVHGYLHEHLGTQYDSGLSPQNITVGGSSALNTSAQISTTAGDISDEDYTHNINAYTFPGNYRVYYQLGATGNWSFKQDNFPFIYSGDASGFVGTSGRAAFNLNTGGVWSLSTAGNGNHVLFHVFATNSFKNTTDMIVIEGQNQYSSSALATTGATTEISNIRAASLFSVEYKPLYSFIIQTTTAASNGPKSVIVAPSTGGQFIDWRTSNLNGATGTSVGGTVTLVDSGTGLTGGPITGSGTLSIDNTYIQGFNDTLRIDSINSTLQSEITNRQNNESDIRTSIDNNYTNLNNKITSIGNWTLDKTNYNTTAQNNNLYYSITNPSNFYNSSTIPSYALLTYVQSLGNWSADKSSYTLLTTFNSIGNWSSDRSSYTNTTTLYSTFTNKTYADSTYATYTALSGNMTLAYNNDSTLSSRITSIGNWSADKTSYNTTTQLDGRYLQNNTAVKFTNITNTGNINMSATKWYQGVWNNGNFSGMCYNSTNIIIGTKFNATAQGCSQ